MTQSRAGAPPAGLADFGFDRVYVAGEVCKWLYVMKGRLQMDEGAISRLAICLSLGERYAPDLSLISQEGGKTFLVASLTGPPLIGKLLFAFLRQRMFDDGLDPHDPVELERQFQAHLARGMLALGVRVKQLADVGRLVQEAQERFRQAHPGLDEDDLDGEPEGAGRVLTPSAPDEHERAPVGATPGGTVPLLAADEGGAAARLPHPEDEAQRKLAAEANTLWGALLPLPVKVAGPKRSVRKKRGVASSRKKRRKRR
jgi:DNA sulfur modification protein DndE